jgi:hypothetical protein
VNGHHGGHRGGGAPGGGNYSGGGSSGGGNNGGYGGDIGPIGGGGGGGNNGDCGNGGNNGGSNDGMSTWYGRCPMDALKLGLCANVLDLIKAKARVPNNESCCLLLGGLVELDAGLCLCTAIKSNVLGINLNIPINLSLVLNLCSKDVPTGFSAAKFCVRHRSSIQLALDRFVLSASVIKMIYRNIFYLFLVCIDNCS